MDLKFEVNTRGEYVLLSVHGEIDLYNVQSLKEMVNTQMDASPVRRLILNIADVEYIDSTGLGILIGIKRRIEEKKGRLCLVLRKERINKLFAITGLNKIFDICATVEEAAQRLSA